MREMIEEFGDIILAAVIVIIIFSILKFLLTGFASKEILIDFLSTLIGTNTMGVLFV